MRHLPYIAVSVIILFCCIYPGISYGYSYYITIPFPSPKPYPGSKVTQGESSIILGLRYVEFEYTVDRSLDEIQHYYEVEMKQYCEDGWQFENNEKVCKDYLDCRVAVCKIPRPFVEDAPQTFFVYLRSISTSQTNVKYIQSNSYLF